jgi:uncharacterized protein (DUF302 family)
MSRINRIWSVVAVIATMAASPLGAGGETPRLNIADTVVRIPLAEGVSMDDAVDSMKLRANVLNFKLVAHQPLYKELQAMGLESKRIEIFQFCDARIAKAMIAHDKDFAAYLPCRITLLEDEEGKAWLITMNLDMLIQSADLPPDLMEKAQRVKSSIQEIMEAGAEGAL